MPYVITDACTKDFVCVAECATASIAPAVDAADAASVTQLYINPDECIDCGNCADLCAQHAIFAVEDLPAGKEHFAEANKAYFN